MGGIVIYKMSGSPCYFSGNPVTLNPTITYRQGGSSRCLIPYIKEDETPPVCRPHSCGPGAMLWIDITISTTLSCSKAIQLYDTQLLGYMTQ